MAELRHLEGDDDEREHERRIRLGATVALDVEELTVRRALVLDAARVEPGGYVERLADELGVTVDELGSWLYFRDARG